MSSDRGIFDNLSNPGGSSPFTAVNAAAPAPSPLSPVERADSPFSVVDEPAGARQVEPGKPAKLPERRPPQRPVPGPACSWAQRGAGASRW